MNIENLIVLGFVKSEHHFHDVYNYHLKHNRHITVECSAEGNIRTIFLVDKSSNPITYVCIYDCKQHGTIDDSVFMVHINTLCKTLNWGDDNRKKKVGNKKEFPFNNPFGW